jgi:hypothetical protein
MAYKVQYLGRKNPVIDGKPVENDEPTGKWTDVGGQPEDMDKAAAEKHMAAVQSTDSDLKLRVVPA